MPPKGFPPIEQIKAITLLAHRQGHIRSSPLAGIQAAFQIKEYHHFLAETSHNYRARPIKTRKSFVTQKRKILENTRFSRIMVETAGLISIIDPVKKYSIINTLRVRKMKNKIDFVAHLWHTSTSEKIMGVLVCIILIQPLSRS